MQTHEKKQRIYSLMLIGCCSTATHLTQKTSWDHHPKISFRQDEEPTAIETSSVVMVICANLLIFQYTIWF